jgi:hypothetical protein
MTIRGSLVVADNYYRTQSSIERPDAIRKSLASPFRTHNVLPRVGLPFEESVHALSRQPNRAGARFASLLRGPTHGWEYYWSFTV